MASAKQKKKTNSGADASNISPRVAITHEVADRLYAYLVQERVVADERKKWAEVTDPEEKLQWLGSEFKQKEKEVRGGDAALQALYDKWTIVSRGTNGRWAKSSVAEKTAFLVKVWGEMTEKYAKTLALIQSQMEDALTQGSLITSLRATILARNATIEEKNNEIKELQGAAGGRPADAQTEAFRLANDKHLQDLEHEKGYLVQDLAKSAAALEQMKQDREAEVANLNQAINEVKSQVTDKERLIDEMKQRIAKSDLVMVEGEAKLSAANDMNTRFHQHVDALTNELAESRTASGAAMARLAELERAPRLTSQHKAADRLLVSTIDDAVRDFDLTTLERPVNVRPVNVRVGARAQSLSGIRRTPVPMRLDGRALSAAPAPPLNNFNIEPLPRSPSRSNSQSSVATVAKRPSTSDDQKSSTPYPGMTTQQDADDGIDVLFARTHAASPLQVVQANVPNSDTADDETKRESEVAAPSSLLLPVSQQQQNEESAFPREMAIKYLIRDIHSKLNFLSNTSQRGN